MVSKLNKKEVVIISAFQDGESSESNMKAHDVLRCDLVAKGFPFKEVMGSYKGMIEKSYVVGIDDKHKETELETLLDIAEFHGQESVLFVDTNRNTQLLSSDGFMESLGKIVSVPKSEAIKRDSWTYDYKYGNYFVTETIQ